MLPAGVQSISVWYQGTPWQRFDGVFDIPLGPGESAYLHLWGLGELQTVHGKPAIRNETGKPIRWVELTRGFDSLPEVEGAFRSGPISHSDVPVAYSLAFLEKAKRLRATSASPRCVEPPY